MRERIKSGEKCDVLRVSRCDEIGRRGLVGVSYGWVLRERFPFFSSTEDPISFNSSFFFYCLYSIIKSVPNNFPTIFRHVIVTPYSI